MKRVDRHPLPQPEKLIEAEARRSYERNVAVYKALNRGDTPSFRLGYFIEDRVARCGWRRNTTPCDRTARFMVPLAFMLQVQTVLYKASDTEYLVHPLLCEKHGEVLLSLMKARDDVIRRRSRID